MTTRTVPRGRHNLPRELVSEIQRERLVAAMAQATAERGYAETTVGHVVACAQMSRATFYECFKGKEDCLLAAHQDLFDRLWSEVVAAAAGESEWPQQIRRGVEEALRLLADDPDAARLLTVEALAAGPAAVDSHRRAIRRAARELRRGRRYFPESLSLAPSAEEALIGGMNSVIASCLLNGSADSLPALTEELTEFILVPFMGPSEARRIAVHAGDSGPSSTTSVLFRTSP